MANTNSAATVTRGASSGETLKAQGVYEFICTGPDGVEKWRETAPNTVTFQGMDGMMDIYFAGSAYTASWWMSLVTAGTATTASTYASPTVTEITSSIVATRPAVTWSAASGGVKSATTTTFTIIGTATITGNMLVTATSSGSTVGNTAGAGGVLFSAAAFSAGSKSVSSGDSLSVSYQLTL